jgi:hypothetical protein
MAKEMERKITFGGVLAEGIGIGIKNALSLLGAVVLWLLTIWVPYINVGTTIALSSIPVALSEGRVISPLFIFDRKYRTFMGEYFMLQGLMGIAIGVAMVFLFIPAIVIMLAWSLAVYILIDKQVSPTDAIVQSNKATLGYKWVIFGIQCVIGLAAGLLIWLVNLADVQWLSIIWMLLVVMVMMVTMLGCNAVIYRKLVKESAE